MMKEARLKHNLRIIATVHRFGKNMIFNKIRDSSKSSFLLLEIMSAPNVYSPKYHVAEKILWWANSRDETALRELVQLDNDIFHIDSLHVTYKRLILIIINKRADM